MQDINMPFNSSNKTLNQNLAGQEYSPSRSEAILMSWANLPEPATSRFVDAVKHLCKLFPPIAQEFRDPSTFDLQRGDFHKHVWRIGRHLQAVWKESDIRNREWYLFKLRDLNKQFENARYAETVQNAQFRLQVALANREDASPNVRLDALSKVRKDVETAKQNYLELMESREVDVTFHVQVPKPAAPRPDDPGAAIRQRLRELNHFWGVKIESAPALTPFERIMFYFQQSLDRARLCANPECPAPYFFITKKGQIYCTEACAAFGQRQAKQKWWANNGSKWRKKSAKRGASK
jgi:hypothetical protein